MWTNDSAIDWVKYNLFVPPINSDGSNLKDAEGRELLADIIMEVHSLTKGYTWVKDPFNLKIDTNLSEAVKSQGW